MLRLFCFHQILCLLRKLYHSHSVAPKLGFFMGSKVPPESVSILGGGIGGMATALALARRGFAVELFEQAPALTAVGSGIQISPNGCAVLAALGLLDEAAKISNTPSSIQFRSARTGRRIARVPMGFGAVLRWGYPYWQFHRVDLLDLLAEAAVAAGVKLHTGKAMLRIMADQDVARLEFVDGSSHETNCLIAADGIRSQVRRQMFTDSPVRFTGHVAWRTVVSAEALSVTHPTATLVHVAPGCHTVSYPIAGSSLINLVAVEERSDWAAEGWSIEGDPAELLAKFGDWPEPVATLVKAAHKSYLWGLFDHPPLETWSKGPVVLLGDAAHPMLPFFAQGATMALEDAFVLARELAVAPDTSTAFATYEKLRKARCTRCQAASAANARMYHEAQPLKRFVQHAGMALISHSLPSLFSLRFSWLYGGDVTR